MRSKATLITAICASAAIASAVIAGDGHRSSITATTANFDLDSGGGAIVAGQIIDTEYAADGLTISATNNVGGHPNIAIAFDSSNPPGHDLDLGTPNQAFAGPGVGSGGGSNTAALGNLLIIAENDVDVSPADGNVDDPDDEAGGGSMFFVFDEPMTLNEITIVDIDTDENGASLVITLESGGGGVVIPIPVAGDNSVQTIQINRDAVESLEVFLPSSGAITNLMFSPTQIAVEEQTWTDVKTKYRD